ncbi:NAD dependent epimerase/dehydratase family protein [Mycobacterium xenopi 3993]|nr:NAD dependent epimerase/dehydratase family protein [Mycobacterium xenopi 3993]
MRILVTGITGVIGRLLARQLVAAGNAVSGIAEYPHDYLDPAVDFVQAPLDDPVLQELADDADTLVHLARSTPAHPPVPASRASCMLPTPPRERVHACCSCPRPAATPSCTVRRKRWCPAHGRPA